jgi:hypothetical protein
MNFRHMGSILVDRCDQASKSVVRSDHVDPARAESDHAMLRQSLCISVSFCLPSERCALSQPIRSKDLTENRRADDAACEITGEVDTARRADEMTEY